MAFGRLATAFFFGVRSAHAAVQSSMVLYGLALERRTGIGCYVEYVQVSYASVGGEITVFRQRRPNSR